MAGICSDLLGISQHEFLFHVHRANQWTVAPFLSLRRSVSSFLGLTPSADLPPLELPHVRGCSYPLSSSQLCKGQNGEQTQAALALPSSCPSSISSLEVEEVKEHFSVHEQGACSRGEPLPQGGEGLVFFPEESRGEAWPQRVEPQGAVLGSCSEESKGDALSQEKDRDYTGLGVQWSAEFERASRATCISDLDEGCLALVMARCNILTLRACSLVCHDWLVASSFARTSMSLQNSPPVAALPTLLARFSRLQTLHIEGLPASPASCLPSSGSPSPDLSLSAYPPTEQTPVFCSDDTAMVIISTSCPSLRELHLEFCSSISDTGLTAILRGCPGLVTLNLARCGGFTGEAFNGSCCKLERLLFNVCDGLTNEGLLAAAAAYSGLQELGVWTEQSEASLAGGLEAIAKASRGLTRVNVHACGILDQTLHCFAKHCPGLRIVAVTCERHITNQGVAAFLKGLPELDTLTLQNNDGLSHVPRFGPSGRLRRLRLGWMLTMPDSVLQGIANESTLEELVLICCPSLTDASVEKILTSCKKLKLLILIYHELVTAEVVKAYTKSGSIAKLQIERCEGVRRDSIEESVLRSAHLEIEFC